MKKKIAVLGATGSIGKNTIEVLRQGDFEPVLFTAHTNREALLRLKAEFPNALLALTSPLHSLPERRGGSKPNGEEPDFLGPDGLLEAIKTCGADIVVNGIAGAAGLEPSIAALNTGCRLALANKETMVLAGPLVRRLASEKNAAIIPVDSEHTAVFYLMETHGRENIEEIIITASGGPFWNYPPEKLAMVTPREALAHPTWNMGPKITVQSATLANKGLEVIEAVRLFDFPPEKVKVIIHPKSIVHAMVRLKDGAVYSQMTRPDMRHPIHGALCWPEIAPLPFGSLDLDSLSLEFHKPDDRFPMLSLAYEACRKGPLYPAVYNAANEIAVEAFLEEKIPFLAIPRIVEYVLYCENWTVPVSNDPELTVILDIDRTARKRALDFLGEK